ncbi:SMP-30/gluconolactonase/LRE family protein [Blastopirellula sp. JC732]|uniref:SMP-30/gluconolactonase/LRE family protein n=1 Tax=Blastopirellula sediminis TaxID=2894196 RepID=A0A9X1SJ26_9BACT|nr:SMP-30/gluconolactonase/LRE family protein [Blastopirellula sediminis]MCC9604814.1 SMP-30/gluconolactonase/LRE family protein [Blastopirellula sediminis]MCC9631887.1 SMP-30/gluconolactonase/LRE family protein [Blastopirellula sediminis]
MIKTVLAASALCLSAAALYAAEPIPGIGPVGEVKTLQKNFAFTEGPSSDSAGNLYFSDIPNDRIYRQAPDGKIAVFLEPAGHTNGTMVRSARLLICQMDGQLASVSLSGDDYQVLAGKYEEKRFNAPNDLVCDIQGGVYFTDPRFRAPDPWPQKVEAVYYLSADGVVTRLIDDIVAPNGVILSIDEKTLYVVPSMETKLYAYDVLGPGKLGKKRALCQFRQPEGEDNQGGDGLTIDEHGNLYVTTKLGVQVISPKGEILGIIEFPEHPANATFGGPEGKTLFVTARTGLYSVEMSVKGHQFPGE